MDRLLIGCIWLSGVFVGLALPDLLGWVGVVVMRGVGS